MNGDNETFNQTKQKRKEERHHDNGDTTKSNPFISHGSTEQKTEQKSSLNSSRFNLIPLNKFRTDNALEKWKVPEMNGIG